MKKTLLQEVKAMNKIAGTEMTVEQEIAIIRERLEQLNELEFGTKKATDATNKFLEKRKYPFRVTDVQKQNNMGALKYTIK